MLILLIFESWILKRDSGLREAGMYCKRKLQEFK